MIVSVRRPRTHTKLDGGCCSRRRFRLWDASQPLHGVSLLHRHPPLSLLVQEKDEKIAVRSCQVITLFQAHIENGCW